MGVNTTGRAPIKDCDVSPKAAIQLSKLATGAMPSGWVFPGGTSLPDLTALTAAQLLSRRGQPFLLWNTTGQGVEDQLYLLIADETDTYVWRQIAYAS